MPETLLIVGSGYGLSASLARLARKAGMQVGLAARTRTRLAAIATDIGAEAFVCDSSRPADVEALFQAVDSKLGAPSLVIYNASYRVRGPLTELEPSEVEKTLLVSAYGGFLVAQQAARRMLAAGRGTILFTGASASVKGYPQSAPFAMGKFALRGLAQSMARELAPKNIHVGHVVIDGAIRPPSKAAEPADIVDTQLDPDAIAQTYWHLVEQPRSAWSWEIEIRPWLEKF
jgi:NAD(P)-dependent dehydrogenase (short-subunit alcohol dehydrogenase family)